MIVAYALGGGLGHLTRLRAALFTLQRTGPVTILTSSPFAEDRRVVGDATIVAVPEWLAHDRAGLGDFVRGTFTDLAPSEIILDTFPAGILGELGPTSFPGGTPVHYLARALRWDRYEQGLDGPAPAITTAHELEPLDPAHRAFLVGAGAAIQPLDLDEPPAQPLDHAGRPVSLPVDDDGRPLWLVVHSGPAAEVTELIDYAAEQARHEAIDPLLVLVAPEAVAPPSRSGPESTRSDHRLPRRNGLVVDVYPAWPLFAGAERVFSGGGFNIMRQMAGLRDPHRPLPFERRFDDQFERVRRARRNDDRVPADPGH